MDNKKTPIIVISAVLGMILIVSLAVVLAFGLEKTNKKASSKKKESTKIHKEVENEEPSEPEVATAAAFEAVDAKTELIDKLVGVWGVPGGGFMYFLDNGEIRSGWFDSEAKPLQHILEVTQIDDNKYELLIKEDEWVYEDVYFEPFTSKFIYDGSIDGFEKVLHLSNDYGDEYLLRIADTFEEADVYPQDKLEEDYRKFEKEVLHK